MFFDNKILLDAYSHNPGMEHVILLSLLMGLLVG